VAAHGMVPAVPGMGTDEGSGHDKDEAMPSVGTDREVFMINMRRAETCHPWSHVVEELRSVQ